MTISYHAHHSPIGADASFTIGKCGAHGGFGIEMSRPADQDVFVGVRRGRGPAYSLPFFQSTEVNLENYLVEGANAQEQRSVPVVPFAEAEITRTLLAASDTWTAPGMTLQIIAAGGPVPDPACTAPDEMKLAVVPAILARLTIDNRDSSEAATAFFGIGNTEKPLRAVGDATGGALEGVAYQREWGFAATTSAITKTYLKGLGDALKDPEPTLFRLSHTGGLIFHVAAGEVKTFTVALGFYRGGLATTGIDTRYYYTRYFAGLEDVLAFGLNHAEALIARAEAHDRELAASALNDDQRFLIAHATHSYYGNTEFLDAAGAPLWVVNEGEYQMMNTFDLTVDMLFYELRMNPWTVKNVLDLFADRYSYYDTVKHPDAPTVWYPGGISFTHDMGVHNQFTPPGYSSYELTGLDGCFSHMTHEQLTNWVLCAALYIRHTGDEAWLERRRGLFRECLQSLLNRDGRSAGEYDGVMNMDSSRCGEPGQEITTYDSLDVSLGQARNNLYLAGKTWASYVALQHIFRQLGWDEDVRTAEAGAARTAATVTAHFLPDEGFIPAVFEEGNASRIIPAIEGLVFPYLMGDADAVAEGGRYSAFIRTLKAHLSTVLVPGVCVDADGHWWKMSSTSSNSWFSKVAICQFVARQVLGFDFGDDEAVYDRAHADWQRVGSSEWAMCDQIVDGIGRGSRYYPRGVSNILWLEEAPETARLLPLAATANAD